MKAFEARFRETRKLSTGDALALPVFFCVVSFVLSPAGCPKWERNQVVFEVAALVPESTACGPLPTSQFARSSASMLGPFQVAKTVRGQPSTNYWNQN